MGRIIKHVREIKDTLNRDPHTKFVRYIKQAADRLTVDCIDGVDWSEFVDGLGYEVVDYEPGIPGLLVPDAAFMPVILTNTNEDCET